MGSLGFYFGKLQIKNCVYLIFRSRGLDVRIQISTFGPKGSQGVKVFCSMQNPVTALSVLENMPRSATSDETHLSPALVQAAQTLSRESSGKNNRILIFTDGEFHDEAAIRTLMPHIAAANIRVDFIRFNATPEHLKQLKRLSVMTGGTVMQAVDIGSLRHAVMSNAPSGHLSGHRIAVLLDESNSMNHKMVGSDKTRFQAALGSTREYVTTVAYAATTRPARRVH